MTIVPPPQYDHPPQVPVIEHVLKFGELARYCDPPPPGLATYGCAHPRKDKCDIFLLEPRFYLAGKAQFDATRRHELAHCNGWPADHPVSRTTELPLPRLEPLKAGLVNAVGVAVKPWPGGANE